MNRSSDRPLTDAAQSEAAYGDLMSILAYKPGNVSLSSVVLGLH